MGPVGFRGSRNVAVGRRSQVQVDRAKRTDTDRCQRLFGGLSLEEGDRSANRLLGVVVSKRTSCRSSGPVPTAQTNLVPPASIAPYSLLINVSIFVNR